MQPLGLEEDILHINKPFEFFYGLKDTTFDVRDLPKRIALYDVNLPNYGSDPDKPSKFAHLQHGCNITILAPSSI